MNLDYKKLAEVISLKARENSTDNLTCILIFLKSVDDFWKKFSSSEE